MKINEGLIIRKEKDFGIIFNTITNKEEFYNEVGIDILSLCDEKHTVEQIIDILKGIYNGKRAEIEKDLLEFIKEQKEKGIIVEE